MDISKQSQARIDWLKAMPKEAQFEAIAMRIENPQIFSQFLASEEDASVWDYAYAAGLISKADADFIKAEEAKEAEDGEEGGEENPTTPTTPTEEPKVDGE
jgi:hypothetical protein